MAETSVIPAPYVRYVTKRGVVLSVLQGSGTFGMACTGNIVWDGSRALASILEDLFDKGEGSSPLQEMGVLELGAGVSGFPAQVCATLGARVTVVDRDVELLQQNIQRAGNLARHINVKRFDWAAFADEELAALQGHQLILCAEVLYEDTWEDVLHLLSRLLTPENSVIMCNTLRKAVHVFYRRAKITMLLEPIGGDTLRSSHISWKITLPDRSPT
jgi:2-polyprenyl-3-methyl-5-hydroxy-6-metoxy-1,4-benzoquinol methylase